MNCDSKHTNDLYFIITDSMLCGPGTYCEESPRLIYTAAKNRYSNTKSQASCVMSISSCYQLDLLYEVVLASIIAERSEVLAAVQFWAYINFVRHSQECILPAGSRILSAHYAEA